ncbi:MAG: ATP-binding protein [Deltaproteobacteria bacterium]|nr:ATP-binding protein [Deltaproteobacteria bacterium]
MERLPDHAIQALLERTSGYTGDAFFRSVARGMAEVLGTRFGFVGAYDAHTRRVHSLAVWTGDGYGDPFGYELKGTPCESVINGQSCQHLSNVQELFPEDAMLLDLGIQAYFGVAFANRGGQPLGLLSLMHNEAHPGIAGLETILAVIAQRTAAEFERMAAEEALRQSEQRFRQIVTSCVEGVWTLGADDKTSFVNETMATMLGLSPGEMIGRPVFDFMDPAQATNAQANLDKRHQGVTERHRFALRHRDGHTVHTWMNTNPLLDAEGGYAGALAMVTDVTEQLALEQKRAESQRLESLGLLAGGVAHDFNNLLVGVMGRADLALKFIDEPEPLRSHLDGIRVAAERAAQLTRQLLAFAGKSAVVLQSVELNQTAHEIASLCSVSSAHGTALELTLHPAALFVRADPGALTQVLMNIITNALQSLGTKGTLVEVSTARVTLRDESQTDAAGNWIAAGQYVTVTVRDDGVGMSPETLARMFVPFFSQRGGGHGLGLASVLGTLRAHGGALQVQSELGKGTTFVTYWPADLEADLGFASPTPKSDPTIPVRPPSLTAAVSCILLADDEPLVRDVMRLTLEAAGYRVETCKDGRAVVDRYVQSPSLFDAVIVDATMPKLSGIDAASEILAADAHAKVIVMSGYNDAAITKQLESVSFLAKPFRADTLLQLVELRLR